MNAADWTERYPLVAREAARIKGTAIIDTEVVCLSSDGFPDFDALHSRCNDYRAVACAFDLLMLDGEDWRRKPLVERKAGLRKLLRRTRGGIQYVVHTEGDGEKRFDAVCKFGLEGSSRKSSTLPIARARRKVEPRSRIRRRQRNGLTRPC